MKKVLLSFAIIFSLLLVAKTSSAQRYFDEIFTSTTATGPVVYGENYGVLTGAPALQPLVMDVYQPSGDTAQSRPLVIYFHTGSFLPLLINGTATGDRHDSATVEMCKQFARRGYVSASMDYRLGWNPIGNTQDIRTGTLLLAVYRAIQDAKTCVRYFKMDAKVQGNTFKIDTNRIMLVGQGSGGYVTLAYASLDKAAEIQLLKFIAAETDLTYGFVAGQPYVNQALWGGFDGLGGLPGFNQNNWPEYGNMVSTVVNMGGAIGDSTWLEAGDVPIVCFHVTNDPFAPYGNGNVIVPTTGQFVVYVSGSREVVRLSNELGNNDVFDIPYNDPYTTRANQINEGFEGLFPFILPDPSIAIPGNPFHGQAGPWEWWDSSALQLVAPAYGVPAANVAVIYQNAFLTNPDASKAKALNYIDSIQGYLAPRAVQAMQLPGFISGVQTPDIFASDIKMFPNPAVTYFTLRLDDPKQKMKFVQLFDMSGKLVREIKDINGSEVNITREGLSTGLYMVKIGMDKKVIQGKLLFE
ncbi:MAG: T9SS type A sorting domain-containing protein [Chitinophagales bacterium]